MTLAAFALAIIVMMGTRVPIELRIFLTAAAIVDDIGAIVVVALFYSGKLQVGYPLAALLLTGLLAALNRAHVYRVAPCAFVGIALWACVHAGGLHATLAGVVLALFIPTRPPADLTALTAQANSIMIAGAGHGAEVLRHGPSTPALRALDAIHDRLLSSADRLLRHAGARSSYLVLPLFALANAGVVIEPGVLEGRGMLVLAIVAGLVIGKPIGMLGAAALESASVSRPSQRSIPGCSSLARVRSPASVSPCHCSSSAKPWATPVTSLPPRSQCSEPRSHQPQSALRCSGPYQRRASSISWPGDPRPLSPFEQIALSMFRPDPSAWPAATWLPLATSCGPT